jgi:hypothetical protein
MLKSFRRKLALRRHPELDPHWQVSKGHPEALPLREELFWFAVPIADLKAGDRESTKPAIAEFFWRNLSTAGADLKALTSYTSPALQDIARFAIQGIARKAGETDSAAAGDDLQRSLDLLAELALDDDRGIRMSVAESLPLLLQSLPVREQALDIAIAQVGDDNYYVWDAALGAIVGLPGAAGAIEHLIETGSAEARCRAPRAILNLAQERAGEISASLIDAATELLTDEMIGIRHICSTAFLDLAELLPDRVSQLQAALGDNISNLFPGFVSLFAQKDSGWAPSTIATQAAELCRHVEPAIELVVELLNDETAAVREGAARIICQLGSLDAASLRLLDELQQNETEWKAQLWMTAAIEAVTAEILPVERWPLAPAIPQMIFFETQNENAIPAGVRFEPGVPLEGRLRREHGNRYLYWPDDHGVTSSDRLLDDYMPLLVDGDTAELDDAEVQVTGYYRKHRVTVMSAKPRERYRYGSRSRAGRIACLLLIFLPWFAGATELTDEFMSMSTTTVDDRSIAVISVQQFDPEATVSIALLPGFAATGSVIAVELDDLGVGAIPPQQILTRIRLSGDGFDLKQPARIAYAPSNPLPAMARAYYVADNGRMQMLPNQSVSGNQLNADLPHASSIVFADLGVSEFAGNVDPPALGDVASVADFDAAIETAEQAQQLGLDDFAEQILEEAREGLEAEIRSELDATPDDAVCPDNTRRLLQTTALAMQVGSVDPALLDAVERQTRSCARSGTVQARLVVKMGGFCSFDQTLPETRFLVASDGSISGKGDARLFLHDVDCPIYVESEGRVELSGKLSGYSLNMDLVMYTTGLVEMPGPNEENPTIARWDEDSATLNAQPLFPDFTTEASPDERSLSFAIAPEDRLIRMYASDGFVSVVVWTMTLGCDGKDPPQDSPTDCWWQVCHAGKIVDVPSELMGENEIPPQHSPTDCLRQVCNGGNVADVPVELMNMKEIPPQVSPNDCERQICNNGIVYDIDEPTEPGCK